MSGGKWFSCWYMTTDDMGVGGLKPAKTLESEFFDRGRYCWDWVEIWISFLELCWDNPIPSSILDPARLCARRKIYQLISNVAQLSKLYHVYKSYYLQWAANCPASASWFNSFRSAIEEGLFRKYCGALKLFI